MIPIASIQRRGGATLVSGVEASGVSAMVAFVVNFLESGV